MSSTFMSSIFYVINHNILLSKLRNAGISGMAFHWLESYCTSCIANSMFFCNGSTSDVVSMKHGVPPGSVLGPTLFSIHYNSIHSAVKHSSCTLFADDTEMYSSDSNIKRAVDIVNEDLVRVEKWQACREWNGCAPRKIWGDGDWISPCFEEYGRCCYQSQQPQIEWSQYI